MQQAGARGGCHRQMHGAIRFEATPPGTPTTQPRLLPRGHPARLTPALIASGRHDCSMQQGKAKGSRHTPDSPGGALTLRRCLLLAPPPPLPVADPLPPPPTPAEPTAPAAPPLPGAGANARAAVAAACGPAAGAPGAAAACAPVPGAGAQPWTISGAADVGGSEAAAAGEDPRPGGAAGAALLALLKS